MARMADLTEHIRKTLPGFEKFMCLPDPEELIEAARLSSQTVVILNISYRCDALVIERSGITALRLSNLSRKIIEAKIRYFTRTDALGRLSVLEWLWKVVAKPVLEHLGILRSPIDGQDWPRICWIPTGSLCRLLIHAAVSHNDSSGQTLLDRVISSYIVSVKSLLYTYRNSKLSVRNGCSSKALLISMENRTGFKKLPFAKEEVDELRELLKSCGAFHTETLYNPRREEILKELKECTVLHFAGHGTTNPADPSKSCLVLSDGIEHGLTAEDIEAARLHDSLPTLAYLSACSTGTNDVTVLLDEGLHLMGACQVAGFQNIVGTMWKVSDSFCVQIANSVMQQRQA